MKPLFTNKIFILLVLMILSSIGVLAQSKKLIHVLIVDGFSNHDWKQTTAVTKWILEKSRRFQVDVSSIPADSIERATWKPGFKKYAVVIQNTNNIQNPTKVAGGGRTGIGEVR